MQENYYLASEEKLLSPHRIHCSSNSLPLSWPLIVMTSISVWYATCGPGSESSQNGANVQVGCFAEGTYKSLYSLQAFIAENAILSTPAEEVGIWMVSLDFELVK